MRSRTLEITTGGREVVHDLSPACAQFLADIEAGDGLLHVWVPHATAGLAVLETGPAATRTCSLPCAPCCPDDRWRHRHGSPGHGRDHVLPAFLPPYATVPVDGGRMALGTWQSVTLVDTNTDNARRQVRLSFLPG